MPFTYVEPIVATSSYLSVPFINGASGLTPSAACKVFEPKFHSYRGASNADLMISYDGVNDALRIPAGAPNIVYPFAFKNLYVRSPAGVTAVGGFGCYTVW